MYLLEFKCVLPHPNTTHSCPGCMMPLMSKQILFTNSFNCSLYILISAMSWGEWETPPSNQNDCTLLICCCLLTPMTLASGGSPMFPIVVHQPASPSIWLAVQSLQRGMSTNPGVTMWCVCGCSWRDEVCRVCGCYRGDIVVMDVILRRHCVSMIWGRVIYLFWVGQGCNEWGVEVSHQSD